MYSILMVDDDTDMLQIIKGWLSKKYTVYTATSGAEALGFLKSKTPDLILLDYKMPDMDGVEALKKIRESAGMEDLPVVFLTGTEERKEIRDLETLRPDGVVVKNTGKAGLLSCVDAFFE